jgi:uncharacterized OB-fold protein
MSNQRPIPLQDRDSLPFWEGLKENRFLVCECIDCRHVFFPSRVVCPECWSSNLTWRQAGGGGVIYSYTIVEAGATSSFSERTPYTLVLVTLDEGCRVFGMLHLEDSQSPAIDLPVKCGFETDADSGVTFPIFSLAEKEERA